MQPDLWYKNAVFYEIRVRTFYDSNGDGSGDLRGLTQKLGYLQELGVDCIWITPVYPSPLMDDGYDIANYLGIHLEAGTLADFEGLIEAAHARGIRLIMDLVLNHTSDQHPWFQAARADRNSPYRDYYVWSDTDARWKEARIIFLDTEKSNWSWDPVAGQYYWHRFFSWQPDLNYENERVREEMINVIRFWLAMGIDGFRADAVPYLYECEGTVCENLPETHAFLKHVRRVMDESYPGRILLCEANQWPRDARAYLGHGDECHMAFHFPLMPRLFMALRQGDRTPLVWVMEQTPPIPENCQWCTFLRNHDELTLEMVTEEDRRWMWEQYAPEPRARLNLGIRRRLAPLLDNDRRKIELANSLLFTMPGAPILYYGDEIGMGDNIWLPDRQGVRTPMQWDSSPGAGFSTADPARFVVPLIETPPYDPAHVNVVDEAHEPDSLLNCVKQMIAVRHAHQAFGWGDFSWVECGTDAVAAYLRPYREVTLFIANNLSGEWQQADLSRLPVAGRAIDLLNPERPGWEGQILELAPYEYRWFQLE